MNVIRAEAMGFCFGVRDALTLAGRVAQPADVTIHGDLVHNETVLHDLRARGFRLSQEHARAQLTDSPMVMVTAHGISAHERRRLQDAGKQLIDTTCPLVAHVHQTAQELQAAGFFVVVIGRRGHVEVCGIVEDLEQCAVVERPEEVRAYPYDRLGIVCQTTAAARDVADIRAAIERRNPAAEIRFVDTVCKPTRDRQAALEHLLDRVGAMVVVGGRNSNNTRRLVARCEERGVPVCHVQSAADLDPAWFAPFETVGLTAGTSTPDDVIGEVYAALAALP
ncbi:MAG: 4-hydroxy-3-methylbut-2-enyl diphosphate reductase [Planctomycetota bacterium]|jgi:4-hydroxy-3-methylbut-2-enyl diphosphate reductase